MSNYNFIELCAGAGGLSSGLISAGLTPLLLNDIDGDCCKTLRVNHPDVNVVLGSFDAIDYSIYNSVDLLVCALPCQSYSQAGQRKGLDDPRGELIYKFIKVIDQIKPKIFMIENVKGLLTHDKGATIKTIIESMDAETYDIKYKLLNAVKYGVPQKRERVFIIGTLKNIAVEFQFPDEITELRVLRDVLYNVPESIGAKYPESKIKLFKMIPAGGCWINLPIEMQKEYLGNSYYSGGGKRGILHRLSMDLPSLTILCSPAQKRTERCHPTEERPLTIRESARIQTFADTYEFVGSLSSQYKQIGNAVPVELARYMGLSIVKFLTTISQ
jgi:DNA (cytosine-5)-methyltransferase 1